MPDCVVFPLLARVAYVASWSEYKHQYEVWQTLDSLGQLNIIAIALTADDCA
nr:hypothetical protein [Desertifilum tharense]